MSSGVIQSLSLEEPGRMEGGAGMKRRKGERSEEGGKEGGREGGREEGDVTGPSESQPLSLSWRPH